MSDEIEMIAALKARIELYENLKSTQEAWAFLCRREEGARETRDLFMLAFDAIERRAKAGDIDGIREALAEVNHIAFEPGGTSLRPEWWHGARGASESPAPSQEVIDLRHDAVSAFSAKFRR